MNNTKWIQVFDGFINKVVYQPVIRDKVIDSDLIEGPSYVHWEEYKAFGGYEYIEWIELDTIEEIYRGRIADKKLVDHKAEFVEWLKAINVPFDDNGRMLTIYGYK